MKLSRVVTALAALGFVPGKILHSVIVALATIGFVAGLAWFCFCAYRLAQLIGSIP